MILANLVLAKSINYDHTVHCKLKSNFMTINYNCKIFIAQTTGLYLFVITTPKETKKVQELSLLRTFWG